MNHSLKAPQNNFRHRSCPAVTPPTWKSPAAHTAKYQGADSCLRSLSLVKAQQGNYTEAIVLLNQLIERHPQNAVDYNNRGLVYFQSGQLNQALADYNRAIRLNCHLSSAYNNRANYYAACGQLEAALADYDQAINLKPSHVRARINKAITLRDLGQYEQAVEDFEIAGVLGQLEGHIYAERGRTYHLWGDWNYAIADYRRALTALPQKDDLSSDTASRLRTQVETWLNQLLNPLSR